MNNTFLVAAAGLAVGIAVGAWSRSTPQTDMQSPDGTHVRLEASATERLAALERIVAEEREARLVLEEQLQALFAEIERIDTPELQNLMQQVADSRVQADEVGGRRGGRRDSPRAIRNYTELRAERLVNGGFTDARAIQVLALEDQVRMEVLQAEYEALQSGAETNPWEQAYNYQASLRDNLGDADFEKYLRAHGSQAAVTVREVIGTSAASRAGLQAGDQIVGYDGERIFSMFELKSKAFAGAPGEDVVVDIERNGQRMQLIIPRGPLGITGNGAGINYRYPFGG